MPVRTGPDHRARPVMTSDKVRPHHLERKALLYVRQSSAHQVLHNRESGALQYAMRDHLAALGWSEIEVIDEALRVRGLRDCRRPRRKRGIDDFSERHVAMVRSLVIAPA